MSDSTESAARALRTMKNESENSIGSGSRQLLNAKVERSPSPDQTCPICLGDITNKSVTNSCLHQFCFFCLCEWSKVKAECPLCKQKFSIIFHTIKSMGDYQEYRVDQPLGDAHSDPHIFINVAVQGATRFGYRTTMGLERRSPMMVLSPMGPMALQANSPFPTHSGVTTRSVSNARAQRVGIEFRRNIYRQNLWVRPSSSQQRIRASSPEFYRLNPAQTHRLVPWLMRELSVLLDGNVFYPETACREILDWITMFPINSADFKRVAHHYFGNKTDHFVHEFYNFASSPHDLPTYDQMARYTQSNADLEMRGSSADPIENGDDFNFNIPDATQLLSPIRLDTVNRSDISDTFNSFRLGFDGSMRYIREAIDSSHREVLNFSSRVAANLLTPPTPSRPIEVIVLSSDEENVNSSNVGDTDVEIQLITLDSDSDNDVIEIKPPTPALIEITDGTDDSPCPSPIPQPASFDAAGPSTTDASISGDRKRSARFFRPWYREYSSSSEEDLLHKKRPLRKKSSSKRPSRSLLKRSRTSKSSRYASTSSSSTSSSSSSSSSSSDTTLNSDSEVEIEEINVWKVKRKSSNGCISLCRDSKNESSKSKRGRKRHSSEGKEDRRGKSPKKARRTLSGGSSTREDGCSKCYRRLKKQSSSSNSDAKRSKTSKRKRRRSYQSSSSGVEEINLNSPAQTASSAGTSSCPIDENLLSGESVVLPGNFARNPKALSKKAIILNKRISELTAQSDLVQPHRCEENNVDATTKKMTVDLLSSPKHDSRDRYSDIKQRFAIPQACQPSTSTGVISANRPVAVVEYSSDSESSNLSIGKEYAPIEGDSSPMMGSSQTLRETAIMLDHSQDSSVSARESYSSNFDISHKKSDLSTCELKNADDTKIEISSSTLSSSSKSSTETIANRLVPAYNDLDVKVNSWGRTVFLVSPNLESLRDDRGNSSNANDFLEDSSIHVGSRNEGMSSSVMTFDHSPLTTPSNSNSSSPSQSSISLPSTPRLKSVVVRPFCSFKSNSDSRSTSSNDLSDN